MIGAGARERETLQLGKEGEGVKGIADWAERIYVLHLGNPNNKIK